MEQAWERGDAVLPLDHRLPAPALRRLLSALRPAALVEADGRTRLPEAVPAPPGTALVVATSGSSGEPKGVLLSHAALRASARAGARRLASGPGDRWLCCLPLGHVAGIQVLVRSALLGTPAVMHPRFDPDTVAGQRGVSLVSLVPPMLSRLLDAGADLGRFRRILLGGAPAPRSLLRRAAAAGATVVTSYGLTETCGGCVYDGRPLDGVKVSLADDGRVHVAGPVLMSGYRGASGADDGVAIRDGWLRTADVGRWLPDGRLRVLGRLDDVIVTGGENVVAAEVEDLLTDHPGVAQVAVLGRPDPRWGQRVVAFCVPAADPPPTLEALRRHVIRRAGAHLAPRELVVVDRLPTTGPGKVDRPALRALPDPPPPAHARDAPGGGGVQVSRRGGRRG
ncbi:MAG: AMP-binding protein [Actinobacteria bacterium]|nr:AMP-binding protein [Actinomycetota bacterium]